MKVKQAIKKVGTLIAGGTMLGATLMGAMAQDLANYPSPFVKNGIVSPNDSVIVVGEKAQTVDVVGAIEIAASLQAAATTPVKVGGSGSTPTITDGFLFSKSGDDLNYNEDLSDIDSKLTDTDLPDLLKTETYDESEGDNKNTEDYDQELSFLDGSATLLYTTDDTGPEDVSGTYLKLNKSKVLYQYEIDFENEIDYNNASATDAEDDFEGSTIIIQGEEYTITDVKMTNGRISEFGMLVGDVVQWLAQDQPLTVGDQTITVISVDEDGSKCGIEVDGDSVWLNVGETKTIGGLEVGLLDAIAVHSGGSDQDTCEVSLGSQELTLEDGQEVKINDQDVRGSLTTFTFGSTGTQWDGFVINYTVGDAQDPPNDDEVFIEPGEEWIDPVFGNWKLDFDSLTANTEEIKLTTTTREGELVFNNIDGEKVTIPLDEKDGDESVIGWGDDGGEFGHYNTSGGPAQQHNLVWQNGSFCDADDFVGGTDVTDCEDLLVLVVSSADEVQVLKLQDIDTTDNEVTFVNTETGTKRTDNYVDGTQTTIDVGFTEIQLTVDETAKRVTFNTIDSGDIQTELGALLYIGADAENNLLINLTEDEGQTDNDGTTVRINVSSVVDNSHPEPEIVSVTGVTTTELTEGSDDEAGTTTYGTVFVYDTENYDKLEITYPETQVFANVFIAPVSATVIGGGGTGGTVNEVHPIPVGLAVLDSAAESMNKNMIVVGGPCVNTIAAELMGNPDDCTQGFEPDKAMIKYFDRGSKVALLVAGYSGQDTRGASYVLADYQDYQPDKLTGNEVEVVVASLSDITVNPAG